MFISDLRQNTFSKKNLITDFKCYPYEMKKTKTDLIFSKSGLDMSLKFCRSEKNYISHVKFVSIKNCQGLIFFWILSFVYLM